MPVDRRTAAPHRVLTRRGLLVGMGAVAAAAPLAARAEGRVITLGSTFDGSSVEQANGMGGFRGAQACFNAINRQGGIGGAKVQLRMADDQFKPEKARDNALAFARDASVIGLMTPLGTRQTAAVMAAVSDMAIVGPNTGTTALRQASPPNLFWVRATYDEEVQRLIRTAATLGTTRIGIVHPTDPLGLGVLAAFQRSMDEVKLRPTVVATTPGTTSPEVEPAARAIAKADPQAVVMALAGMAPKFIQALRAAGCNATVYGLSVSASAGNIATLGAQGRGLEFAIVVPSPFAPKHQVVRQYQADMLASGWPGFSLPSLEGYINARVMAEGLRRAGPNPSRASLIDGLSRIEAFDVGGLRIGYGPANRVGGHFVDVAVLGADGSIRT